MECDDQHCFENFAPLPSRAQRHTIMRQECEHPSSMFLKSLLVATSGLFSLVMGCGLNAATPPASSTPEDIISKLKRQITEQENESAQAVANYVPTINAKNDDLESPVVDVLRSLPGVAQVEVLVKSDRPTHRIIHLRDWHFVPKDAYAIDMNDAHGRKLPEAEFDWLYQKLLLEVELVQIEQMAVLRILIKHHGLKRVFAEGFSPAQLDAYRERIAVLKAMEDEQIPRIRRQLDEVGRLLKDGADEKTQAIKTQLQTMLDEHRRRLLEMGAAGRLLIAGELEEVLPLEDGDALEGASPISANGVTFDFEKIEARHDAQVSLVTKERTVAVIVLGGAHDLSASVRRMSGNCEYLRVTTKGFGEREVKYDGLLPDPEQWHHEPNEKSSRRCRT